MMRRSTHYRRRLFLCVSVLNLAGLACLGAVAQVREPAAKQGFECVVDVAYLLESIGFTLMLPGIFFAAAVLLCARLFAWSEPMTCAVWYASGFAINFISAWRAGDVLHRRAETRP